MKRIGAKNSPVFRIVVADGRSPRDGKFIEEIGTYHPRQKGENVKLDLDRVNYWVGQGAQRLNIRENSCKHSFGSKRSSVLLRLNNCCPHNLQRHMHNQRRL